MTDDELVGRWRLVSWTANGEQGGVSYPFGARAEGSVVYTAGGWMSGHLAAGGRLPLPSENILDGTEAQRAAAFSSYVAYCGSYRIDGDVVVHEVQMSLLPNWVGIEQLRSFELSGDMLLLKTPPIVIGADTVVNELHWIREE